jgi:hypothetical protein
MRMMRLTFKYKKNTTAGELSDADSQDSNLLLLACEKLLEIHKKWSRSVAKM